MFASREQFDAAGVRVDLGFTDRYGGVSQPPFDSFNLGRLSADAPDDLSRNFSLLAQGFGVSHVVTMSQLHGVHVVVVAGPDDPQPRCDGLVTKALDVALCVRVADCVPVLLFDATAQVVGAAHAGRDGMANGVVTNIVAAMHGLGAKDISAWVGPHICGGCYEVPAKLRAEVSAKVPSSFACTTWGTPAIDVGAGVTVQLRARGVEVRDRARCTRESADLFSYRRDGASSGRMAGVIVMRSTG